MPQASTVGPRRGKAGPAGFTFANYFLAFAGAVVVVIGAAGYWAYQHWIVAGEQSQLEQLAQDYAGTQASALERRLNELKGELRRFTRREELTKALVENNSRVLDDLKDSLRKELSGLRDVRVFKAGIAQVDLNADTPVRFADLDMINRSEKRATVFPEAGEIGDEWRISLVEPVPFAGPESTDTSVAGVLFVSVEAKNALLGDASGELPGRVELLHRYPQDDGRLVTQLGEGFGDTSGEAEVANSYFVVRFTPSAALATQVQANSFGLFASLGAIFLAGMAAAYLLATALGRSRGSPTQGKTEMPAGTEQDTLLDLELSQEDRELLGQNTVKRPKAEDPLDIRDKPAVASESGSGTDIAAEIFRSYDIRGLVDSQLSPENVVLIGRAIGSQALALGEKNLVVGRDGRSHSLDVAEQLIEGILATGCNAINIGMVPTPLMYFACHELDNAGSGIMVTASHNPPEYNGFKIVLKGNTLKDDDIQQLRTRILRDDFSQGAGKEDFADMSAQYIERIFSDVALAGEISLVIDAGNGAAGEIAPILFEELGCKVTPLFCEVDGSFPNHSPDPSVAANLQALVDKVGEVGADLGIALDGDGDRVAVVTASGAIVPADRLLMLLAKDIVSRNPGADVLFDVKCSRELNSVISSYGGRPIMWKSGHSHMKAKMQETGALLGGELSGHIFIKERWYGFDDGLYAAARVIEIMSLREQDMDSILENFPCLPATPEIKVAVDEDKKFALIKRLIQEGEFGQGRVTAIDGLRVDFPEGWGLVRASNTSAALTLRFEAETQEKLEHIASRIKEQLLKIDPQLTLNF